VDHYHIKSDDWKIIYAHLKEAKGVRVTRQEKTRQFLEGVYYIMRTGAQWRELPHYYGKWRSVHKRYTAWCQKGLWNRILHGVTEDHDSESIMIDATIVRAHPCAAGYKWGTGAQECLGRSKGGFTTKIHAVVDALGQALRFIVTEGKRHDSTQASALIEGLKSTYVIADKGYDTDSLIQQITAQHAIPVIPPRKNRKVLRAYDSHIYKERHLIECFFGKIKHFRRVFSRFDKKASSFLGFLAFASIIIRLR